ncbi:phosphoribosylanthranilate isomerase [Alkalilimnicola sp. S0819]|uniref:phosphoribosylanthranilate isomerase n=1 Tax=Alkalilimnicola sp. S0819 TaxID=2613922 RepID=UPI0012624842|nr:phosphoribosylanthranilate isomerase [Alkalilimnicola sp. S0819]KAB7627861.1 phosphoribosylanthranilate isomerase [Alkalilimnicola sp. S0819]MPQ15495.1 phosphoribosylanthranilate isomerase [Alkalilimnicola sp. S0819]
MHSRIKICGFTRPEDVAQAARLGVDAVGLVFAEGSSRQLDLAQARAVAAAVPAFVSVVALFLDQEADLVRRVLAQLPVEILQFHGQEAPEYCRSFGRRYIKAVPMAGDAAGDCRAYAARYPDATGLLLDSHAGGALGGTGEAFDWGRIPADLGRPLILAGGLGPDNVAAALRQVRPYAVDVSSGVESAKGIKDAARMAAFIDEVRRVQSD